MDDTDQTNSTTETPAIVPSTPADPIPVEDSEIIGGNNLLNGLST